MGVIDFTMIGGAMFVSSYSQDSYLGTAGGTFYLRSTDLRAMGGSIDLIGNMRFDPNERQGLAYDSVSTLGEFPWNIDDSVNSPGGNGLYDQWTTGTSTNRKEGQAEAFTMTGTALSDVSARKWSATLVSAGNIGAAWGAGFDGTQYSELFNVEIILADPVANDDTVAGPVNTPIIIDIAADLLANDTFMAGETISFVSFGNVIAPSTVVYDGDNTLTYTPDPALLASKGVDSFTYVIEDTDLNHFTSTATVNVNLAPPGTTPPVAEDDNVAATEDTALDLDPVAGTDPGIVTDHDADPGQTATLAISAVDAFSANDGAITWAAGTNDLTYTPKANFKGLDTFQYTIEDVDGLFDSATVTVDVSAVNDTPVCSDVNLRTAVDTALDIDVANDLLSECTDEEGDALSLAVFDTTGDNNGTLSDDGAGTLTYTPFTGFTGTERFSFTATDGTTDADPNVLAIEILPPYTGQIEDVDVSFSMGLWSLLAGLFSVFGLRRIHHKK